MLHNGPGGLQRYSQRFQHLDIPGTKHQQGQRSGRVNGIIRLKKGFRTGREGRQVLKQEWAEGLSDTPGSSPKHRLFNMRWERKWERELNVEEEREIYQIYSAGASPAFSKCSHAVNTPHKVINQSHCRCLCDITCTTTPHYTNHSRLCATLHTKLFLNKELNDCQDVWIELMVAEWAKLYETNTMSRTHMNKSKILHYSDLFSKSSIIWRCIF